MVLLSIRNKERDLDLYPDELGPLVGEFDDDIMLLMDDLEAGNIDADEWRDRFAAMLAGAIALAYFVGMGGTIITADQRAAIDAMLAEQLAYLNRFYEAVAQTFEAGGEFDPAWRSRASMYADAVTEPFWEARTWPWPLPAYPGDGTSQCLTHCRCDWVIQVIDEAAGDADAFWMLGPVEHCQTCLERARRWNPLQIRGWKLPLYDTISKDDARALEKLSARLAQMAEVVALKHLIGKHDQSRHGQRFGDQANAAQLSARARSAARRAGATGAVDNNSAKGRITNELIKKTGSVDDADVYIGVMGLSRDHFIKYANKLGIKDAAKKADEFFAEQQELTRQAAVARWNTMRSNAFGGEPNIILGGEVTASLSRVRGKDAADAISQLEARGVRVTNNGMSDANAHAYASAVLNAMDDIPVLGKIIGDSKGLVFEPANSSSGKAGWAAGDRVHLTDTFDANVRTLVHEFGHIAEEHFASGLRGTNFGSGHTASMYGSDNPFEDFAEWFTGMVGRSQTGALRAWSPDKYDYLIEKIPGMKEWVG